MPFGPRISPRARELHRAAIVVDAHVDTVLAIANEGRRIGQRNRAGHVDLPRLRAGGVDVQFFAHYIEPEFKPDRALPRFLELLAAFYRQVDANADAIHVVRSYPELMRTVEEGKLAAVISIEGGEALAGRLALLEIFYRLGVRAIGLTWNERNDIADGVGEARSAGGLTRFGRQVVREMNRLGILIDVSHLAEPGFWDVLEETSAPVIASHSNARAVCDHIRNLSDAQIKALAENGGVMGLNFYPAFVAEQHATLDHLIHHIDHVVDLVGPDHIGLGSDFDGIPTTPEGLEDVSKLPHLTERLIQRGYDEPTIRKILGENYLRVFKEVWRDDR